MIAEGVKCMAKEPIERTLRKVEGFLRECTGEDKVVSTDGEGEGSDRVEDQHGAGRG
jgi:hypothetical protein